MRHGLLLFAVSGCLAVTVFDGVHATVIVRVKAAGLVRKYTHIGYTYYERDAADYAAGIICTEPAQEMA